MAYANFRKQVFGNPIKKATNPLKIIFLKNKI